MLTANIVFNGDFDQIGSTDDWYTITEFGIECIKAGNTLPFDPDGYIREIYNRIPNIDPIVLDYLSEAVVCNSRGLWLSSTICLGVASEKSILVLVDKFAEAISDVKSKASFKKSINEVGIYKRYTTFQKEFEKRKRGIPPELLRNFQPTVDGVFNFIRLNRNDAGHPTGAVIDRIALQYGLQMFARYAEEIFGLIKCLENKNI